MAAREQESEVTTQEHAATASPGSDTDRDGIVDAGEPGAERLPGITRVDEPNELCQGVFRKER